MRFRLMLSLGLIAVAAVFFALQRIAPLSEEYTVTPVLATPAADGRVLVRMESSPYPLTVGDSTLLIFLTDTDRLAVKATSVSVSGRISHGGMIPIQGSATEAADGIYRIRVSWPMTGQWVINVQAELTDGRVIDDAFEAYIYSIPPHDFEDTTEVKFRSIRENLAAVNANIEREQWIIIPQGTLAMLRQGHSVMPEEIRLNLRGQNTLVIRNDDFFDHTIGPFFIRSGETIRQTFTQAMVFQGVCSVSSSGSISIVVDA